jgi:hypothetical protein
MTKIAMGLGLQSPDSFHIHPGILGDFLQRTDGHGPSIAGLSLFVLPLFLPAGHG